MKTGRVVVSQPTQFTDAHVLILSTADWNRPLWTNKQFVARELARYMDVTYVNSIGLRRPTPSMADASRVIDRLLRSRKRLSIHEANGSHDLTALVSPLVVPFHSNRLFRRLNRYTIEKSVTQWLQTPKDRRILWSFSPITYGLETQATATVYHCVDLLGEFPGVDARAVGKAERSLAASDVTAIASSSVVATHLSSQGFSDIYLWENVADVSTFSAHAGDKREPDLVVFAGNLTEHKVDCALLSRIADCDSMHLVLAGTIAEGGGSTDALTKLLSHPRIDYVGPLKPLDLAKLLGRATVGLVPYQINGYTAGVFPMKVYEYLGAGLPIITTALPSLRHLVNADMVMAHTAAEFVESTARFASETPQAADIARRVATANNHSWEARGAEAAKLVEKLVARSRAADPAATPAVAHND